MAFSFSDEFYPNITKQLTIGEGEELVAYRCPSKKLTVGIGHNCDASPVPGVSKVGDRITPELSQQLFVGDLNVAIKEVRRVFPWVAEMSEPRQAVIYDMAFNMGIGGLQTFTTTMPLIRQGKYEQARRNIFASKYARDVNSDGIGGRFDRVERLMEQLIKDKWVFKRGD